MRVLEHVDRHLRHAAELPRQRPFGAGAVAQDAAEDLHVRGAGEGRGAGDLLHLGLAIDREEAHAELEARTMSRSFLIVLPKEMRSAVAPASSTIWISTTEAVSKHEPSSARSFSTSGSGFAFTA